MGREKERFGQLLRLLPEGWEAKAKELGAFQRAREIKTPGELLRMILVYLTEGKSFAGTSAIARLSGETKLSKVAVFKRMRNSAAWLKWLCEHIYRQAGLTVAKPRWLKNKNVILVDGTEEVKCGVRRQCYMLHYSLDLFTLAMREMLVTDRETGEKLANFKRLGKKDIVMGDRAYGNMPGLLYLNSVGAGYVLRIQSRGVGNGLYTLRRQKIDLLERLSTLNEGKTVDIRALWLNNGKYEPIRICAVRKDRESERVGLKRLAKTNQRKKGGKAVTGEQRENNKYIIVAASLGEEVSAAKVLELYRARWQIEIAFKRLKSLFHYNDLPAKHSESAKAWFYGKLLLAALCETLVNTGRFSPSGSKESKETVPSS
jgi:hypothetical protein